MDHDSDSDADDTDEAPTPADSIHHGHRDDAHVYDSTGAAEVTRDRPDLGARHGSISSLARKMHYSSLEDSEDLISLARAARVDDDEEADAGLDAENPPSPTTAEKDPTDTPEDMLANLVQEYGPWTDDSERFVMQVSRPLGWPELKALMLTKHRCAQSLDPRCTLSRCTHQRSTGSHQPPSHAICLHSSTRASRYRPQVRSSHFLGRATGQV